ncbi:helix-turn-helix transcriptional regulator [Ruminococcus sp. YE282]|uniref:helix-turn-helix domain-containing protein n=1 Tax=Ruminococcus sp. YE282 TaxID=3158780 RepID=UPI00088A07C8|nr:Helix-turn-helix domain-containing protein [Ruminococcus bromii]
MKKSFGAFLSEKRVLKDISLRHFSKIIGISPEYLSKIENNLRPAPKDIVLEKIADKLSLSIEDREILFDLAAESKAKLSLATDLVEYIRENEIVHKTLRLAKRCKVTTEEWQEIFDNIAKKHL